MAPLQPLVTPGSLRGGKRSSSSGVNRRLPPESSASFHGRTTPSSTHQKRRPKTHPDLLTAGPGGGRMIVSSPMQHPDFLKLGNNGEQQPASRQMKRVPAKVLVNVNVMGSVGALQVMASTEWTVDQLVAASIKQYLNEGRRPPLPAAPVPSAFSLHYSQFCLDCLDRKEKLVGLGSRSFFLCPQPNVATTLCVSSDSSAPSSSDSLQVSSQASSSCSREAGRAPKLSLPWLRFMDFLL